MDSNTISIKPIPQTTTLDEIRDIFSAYTTSNVHIQGQTAYVKFTDAGDLEILQLVFTDLSIPQLNNAYIDIADDFDWNKIIKEVQTDNKKSSNNSSDKHEDLLAADTNNLIVIKNCNQVILKSISEIDIKSIFKQFNSVNRILKQNEQVIVQILDKDQIQLLQARFSDLHIPQLGKNSKIQSAEENNIDPEVFSTQWSKASHSRIRKPNQQQEQRRVQGIKQRNIFPLDKRTSMEVNLFKQQTYGYNQQLANKQPISQAPTYQQLGYPSEQQIKSAEQFGYEAQEKKKRQLKQQQQQQQQRLRKYDQQKLKMEKQRQQERRNHQQIQQERNCEQKIQQQKRQQQQRRRQQQIEEKSWREEQSERKQKQQEQTLGRLKSQEESKRLKKQQQEKRVKKQQQQRVRKQQQEIREQEQQERIKRQAMHNVPTQAEEVNKQLQFIQNVGETIQQQLGYFVNQAKAGSANLVNAGIQLLKQAEQKTEQKLGYGIEETKKLVPEINTKNIGYASKDKLNLEKLQKYGYGQQQQSQKWSVRPEQVARPVSGTHRGISRGLVSVTLVIWVLFLLLQ